MVRRLHGGQSFILGHVEAKDVGTNLDETERSDQIKNRYLPALLNLVLALRELVSRGTELRELHVLENQRLRAYENPLSMPLRFPEPGENRVQGVRYVAPGERVAGRETPLGPREGRVYISPDRPRERRAGQYFEGFRRRCGFPAWRLQGL